MSITAHKLYRDTGNFFRNQFINIILISLLTAFITFIVNKIISPNINQLTVFTQDNNYISLFDFINDMSNDQKFLLLRIAVSSITASLIGNTILLLGILYLISIVSSKNTVNIFNIFKSFIVFFPKILIQTFLITIVVQIGFLTLMIPGIILTILLSLSPLILFNEKINIIDAIKFSILLSWKNIKLVTPAVMFWLFLKLILILLISTFNMLPSNITITLLNILSNIFSSALIIYLYRLYMLVI